MLPLADTNFVESTGVGSIKCVVIFAFVLAVVPMILLLERKLLGRFQNRYGPNRVGPYGLLQPLADVLKLLCKEQFYPATGVPFLMALAPAIMIVTALASIAIIPFGDVKHGFGVEVRPLRDRRQHRHPLRVRLRLARLLRPAARAAGRRAPSTRSWARCAPPRSSSATRCRSACRLIGVVMMAGSLSLVDIVKAQDAVWYVLPAVRRAS